MATVVNVSSLQNKMTQLGWEPIHDLPTLLQQAGIPAKDFAAYLDGLIAAPSGMDDQNILNCPTTSANKLTKYFRDNGDCAV